MNSESWLRTQYQNVIKERDELQLQCEQLKNENYDLKRAVFELTQQITINKQYKQTITTSTTTTTSSSSSSHLFLYNTNNKQFEFSHNNNNNNSNNNNNNNNNSYSTSLPLLLQENQIIQRNNENRTLNFECELRGHSGAVYCVDISPDNRWIASGSFDKTIVIWKGNFPYKQVATLTGHTQLVSGLCWGHDPLASSNLQEKDKKNEQLAPILFSTSFDKTVRIWDPLKGECIEVVKLKGYGTSLTFCPRSSLYPCGCVITTTSTNYFYLISHPFNTEEVNRSNTNESNDFEAPPPSSSSTSLIDRRNLLSPIQLLPSSPTSIPNTNTTYEFMRSRSNSDSYVIGASLSSYNNNNSNNLNTNNNNSNNNNNTIVPLQAVYYKHNNGVPSSIVCLSDGTTIFVGDTSGVVTWYEMKRKDIPEGNNYTIGGYVPNIRGKYIIEEGRSVRVLYMQIAGGFQKDYNLNRSNELSNSKSTTSSRYISRSSPSQNSILKNNSLLLQQPTLLAIQCSDNTIRLYHLIVNSQNQKTDGISNDFLVPLRLLRDHTTGGQWPIRMSFRQGPLYRISLPKSIHNENKLFGQSDFNQSNSKSGIYNTNHLSLNQQQSFHQNSKQILKVKATDINELKPSLSTNSLAANSGDDNPSVSSATSLTNNKLSLSKHQTHILSDDISIASDPSESNNQHPSQLLKQTLSKQRTESRDEADQETEDQSSVLSAKFTTSVDDGGNEVFENESIDNNTNNNNKNNDDDNEDDNDDDDDDNDNLENKYDDNFGDEYDNDNYLNMVAGLATSSLLTSNQISGNNNNNSNNNNNNNINIGHNSNNDSHLFFNKQTMIKSSKIDDLDILYSGMNSEGDKLELNSLNQQSSSIQWESSFVLATGSNNGQVFIYDLSSLSNDQKKGNDENDIDSAVILPAWKILDGHQATGKAYGAIFTFQQSLLPQQQSLPSQQQQTQLQQQISQQSSLITFGSDGTLQLWSVVHES